MQTFNVYLTDLFCGELNYSFVEKLRIKAKTERGAVIKAGKYFGLKYRKDYESVYHSTSKLSALVFDYDESYDYDNVETI